MISKKKYFIVLLICGLYSFSLQSYEPPVPLLSFGGGPYYAGPRHSGAIAQVEYKFGTYWWGFIRPQVTLSTPEFKATFIGAGIAAEFYLCERLVFSPNFCPGIYFQGDGRDLGYPLEFRSAVEIAYEFRNLARLGTQFWHISNASLSDKNPGANAWVFFFAFPIRYCFGEYID